MPHLLSNLWCQATGRTIAGLPNPLHLPLVRDLLLADLVHVAATHPKPIRQFLEAHLVLFVDLQNLTTQIVGISSSHRFDCGVRQLNLSISAFCFQIT